MKDNTFILDVMDLHLKMVNKAENYIYIYIARFHSLDEPFELVFFFRAAKVGGPGVADGELVKFKHVHDPHLSHGAAKQLWPLVHACRCIERGEKKYIFF